MALKITNWILDRFPVNSSFLFVCVRYDVNMYVLLKEGGRGMGRHDLHFFIVLFQTLT